MPQSFCFTLKKTITTERQGEMHSEAFNGFHQLVLYFEHVRSFTCSKNKITATRKLTQKANMVLMAGAGNDLRCSQFPWEVNKRTRCQTSIWHFCFFRRNHSSCSNFRSNTKFLIFSAVVGLPTRGCLFRQKWAAYGSLFRTDSLFNPSLSWPHAVSYSGAPIMAISFWFSLWTPIWALKARHQLCCQTREREEDKERELVIRGYFHVLFDYFNSRTDPFCLALQLQALGLQWLASRSTDDSLSSFSLHVIGFIMFQMLILCLILLSLTVHAFSHNTDGRGNTKGRGNLGGVELKISSGEQREKKTASFFCCFPSGCVSKNVSVENKILDISARLSSIFSFLWQHWRRGSYSFQAVTKL